jgi:hypothetical protein
MVMMTVRFPSESCPTWEPFNLVSKDKNEGQMLSLFDALTSFLSYCRACGHAHTHIQFPLIVHKMQSVSKNCHLHVRDRCSLLFLVLLVSVASLKNSKKENSMLRG